MDQQLDPSLELEQFLPYRLNVLATLLSRSLASTYQEHFGISIPEWRILATLGRESPLSAGEVGARTTMEKPRVSRTLNRLLKAGFIIRHQDPRDNRRAVLKLSRRGMDLYRRIIPRILAWEAELLAELSPEERAILHRLLDRLQERVQILGEPEAMS